MNFLRLDVTADVITTFDFKKKGYKFLIKNFTDDDIYIGINSTDTKDKMLKLPSDKMQYFEINEDIRSEYGVQKLYVIANTTTSQGVEIQCIK